jgi:hypothetical protein
MSGNERNSTTMGRPPIGKVAMTSAERVRRYRIKHPVTKVTKSLEQARHAYVASLPTDHEARREELVALARALEGLITMDEARRFTEEVDSIDYLVKEAAAPKDTKRKERDLARKITATLAANQPDEAIKHVNESEPAAESIPVSSVLSPVTEMKFRPPDLIDFSMTPNRRLSAVRCQETEFRWC